MEFVSIDSIEIISEEEVWDISMLSQEPFLHEEPNFVAQDIVVHNSHAAGVVISPMPLSEICPLHYTQDTVENFDDNSKTKTVATQFTMSDVESLGLIKIDVLGLSTKTAISWAVENVKNNTGKEIDVSRLPLDDPATIDLLNSGCTDGCFQLENPGMQRTLQQLEIKNFDDLVIAVAMYRPGPKEYISEMADRKKGLHPVSYPHPMMEEITKVTYGILVYQEQIMQAFMRLADLTATEGYVFIKGCAKKKPDLIASSLQKFEKGAAAKGIPENVVQRISADMKKFGGYAFNKTLHFSEGIATSKGEHAIEELFQMDRNDLPQVHAPNGELIDIVDIYDHGVVPMYEVTFSDGSSHKCTGHHKFDSTAGILPLHEIVERGAQLIVNMRVRNASNKDIGMSSLRLRSHQQGTMGSQTRMRCMEDVRSRLFGDSHFLRRMGSSKEEIQVYREGNANGRDYQHCDSSAGDVYWAHVQIVDIKPIGLCQGYDLEIDSADHLYCLSSGIVNSNSHSVSYAYESWKTAYLKSHYPMEFFAARLSVENLRRNFDDVVKYENDAIRNYGIEILPPDINKSGLRYQQVAERQLRKPLLLKGVGYKAAEDIVAHQPYKGKDLLYSFGMKVGPNVNTKVVEAMYDAGLWSGYKRKSKLLADFDQIRKDKRACRGEPTDDLFG